MSITSMAPSLRLGLASTVVPFQAKVMPEPRCGMPAIGSSAILRRTSRLTTWPWGRRRLVDWLGPRVAPSTWRSSGRRRSRPAAPPAACGARPGSPAWRWPRPSCSRAPGRHRWAGLGVVGNLPELGNVLERHHKAAARRSVVHRRHARGLLAVERGGVGVAFDQVQVGVEQHHGARQVVGRHHPAAVAADGHVAHVQAGAHLGHHGGSTGRTW
jgi:hypothetical protein